MIQGSIDNKLVITTRIIIKFINIRKHVFDNHRENDTYANEIYA